MSNCRKAVLSAEVEVSMETNEKCWSILSGYTLFKNPRLLPGMH